MKRVHSLRFSPVKSATYVSALVLICFSNGVCAQTILEWKTCVRETARNNPNLLSAQEKIIQAGDDKAIAQSGEEPQVSGSANAGRSGYYQTPTTNSYSYGASASQLLFDGGKTYYEISQADAELTASRFTYQSSSSDIRLSLRNAFINLSKAQDQVVIAKGIMERRNQSARLVKLGYEAGREHKGALLTAEAKYAQARADVGRAERNVPICRAELARQMGWTNSIETLVVENSARVDVDQQEPAFEALVRNVPYLKYLAAQTSGSMLGVKSARAGFLPTIQAGANAGNNGCDWPPKDGGWNIGISLSLPIFDGGNRMAQVRKAISQQRSAEADERSGMDSLLIALRSAWVELRNATDDEDVAEKFLEAAKERATIGEAQYSTGGLSFDNWIIIEDDYASAENSLLDAKAEVSTAEANWIHAKGGTLENEINW